MSLPVTTAMILAAGLGTRMRPLTDSTPKPLLSVGGSTLIELHLNKLANAGIKKVVINVSHLAEQIIEKLGDGEKYHLDICYSREDKPLETAGGIKNALPLLGNEPFVLINGDIWSDFPLEKLVQRNLIENELAHLVLVENPEHNSDGDFSIDAMGRLIQKQGEGFTFSGISLLSPDFFQVAPETNLLGEHFKELTSRQNKDECLISAELYTGSWIDVGTPERLEQLRELLSV